MYLIFREFRWNQYYYLHWHEKFQFFLFIFRMAMIYRELILMIIATHMQSIVSLFFFFLSHVSPWLFFPKNFLRCGKCSNSEFLMVRVFPHSNWIRKFTEQISVFSRNTGKYGPPKTQNSDTFHCVYSRLFQKNSEEVTPEIFLSARRINHFR